MDIVKRINDLLGSKDWSIHQLSLESDVPRSVLYRIMAHEVSPTYETITKICDGFDITVSEFFNEEKTPLADEVLLLHSYRCLSKNSKKVILIMIKQLKE